MTEGDDSDGGQVATSKASKSTIAKSAAKQFLRASKISGGPPLIPFVAFGQLFFLEISRKERYTYFSHVRYTIEEKALAA
jgi:hypothetical protein